MMGSEFQLEKKIFLFKTEILFFLPKKEEFLMEPKH